MPITIAAPPQQVPVFSGFDYVAMDERRERAYAAHTPSRRLLVVDTQSAKVLEQIAVGPLHGIAVDPATGIVFTGGTDDVVSKVDPAQAKVLAKTTVPGSIDAIAYDPTRNRIYADQSGGDNVYVIDAATMKLIGAIAMPNDDLESPAVDPATGTLYQNLAGSNAFAIVDPASLRVAAVVLTPQLQKNHPLVFSAAANQVIVGGVNGVLSAYTPDGKHVGDVSVAPNIDQCGTGPKGNLIVCAGRGVVTLIAAQSGAAPRLLGRLDTGHRTLHTVGIDEATGDVWVVYSDERGDWVQRLRWSP